MKYSDDIQTTQQQTNKKIKLLPIIAEVTSDLCSNNLSNLSKSTSPTL